MANQSVPIAREVSPNLRLERLRVRNFRRILHLDLHIPEQINFICFVGPNGSGKSALCSVLVHALTDLTYEAAPDAPKSVGQATHLRNWTTSEIGPGEVAYALRADWKFSAGSASYVASAVHLASASDRVNALLAELGIPPNQSFTNMWMGKPTTNVDPVARSVVLERPASRFETPYYEEPADLVSRPRVAARWEGRRLLPFRSEHGVRELEDLILDLILDSTVAAELHDGSVRLALEKLMTAFELLMGERPKLNIPRGSVRKSVFLD